jgi:1-acyl-sn-glycerol-3-phosphate acyltransferase
MRKAATVIYSTYAALMFCITLIIAFPFIVIASFFGRIVGGNAIMTINYIWSHTWLILVGVRHQNILKNTIDFNQPYVYVLNHGSYIDGALLLPTIGLHWFRPLGKYELTKTPLFGYIYSKVVVTVDRSSKTNRAGSITKLKALLKKNISVLIFPEGTFNTSPTEPLKEFYNGAFRIAKETQTPIQPIILLDNTKRWHHSGFFTMSPGRSRSVYLPTIPLATIQNLSEEDLKTHTYNLMEKSLNYLNNGNNPQELHIYLQNKTS